MSAIRVTAMLCMTALVIITGALVYANKQDRYVILPQNNSMFIFDRQTASVNYCTADQCRLVMPYGSASMPGMMPGMAMPGMPPGFQPFAMPNGSAPAANPQQASMVVPTGMAGTQQNNPMMMWAYMQAASAMESQKGGFSSLQTNPSWMNIMAMMQPTAAPVDAKTVSAQAQSPLVPVAMKTSLKKAVPSSDESNNEAPAAPADEESAGGGDEEAAAAPAGDDSASGDDDEEA